MSYIRIGKTKTAQHWPAAANDLTRGDYAHGYFIEPTVFTDATPDMRIAQEEIFGPVTTVIPANSLEDAIQDCERSSLRSVRGDLHSGCQPRVPRDERNVHRHLLRQCLDYRRGSPPAIWRHQSHRQWSSRSGNPGARYLLGMEIDLRRLQWKAAASAD